MRGRGEIVVGAPDVLRVARSEPPFSVRKCADRILLAASAAGPLGGDELELDVVVEAGARADIGSVAAVMIHPDPTGAASTQRSRLTVGAGGHLDWRPEPSVSIAGSDHSVDTTIDLAADATCRIVEEVSLGRSGEPSGRLRLSFRVVRAGVTLVHHAESFGPDVLGAGSVVSVGAGRHVVSCVLVGVDASDSRVAADGACRAAWLPVAADAAVVLVVAPDRPAAIRALDTVAPELAGAQR
jgi:urease accessory protein